MNPGYLLALKLGIPIVLQPKWDECQKLRREGNAIIEVAQNLKQDPAGETVTKMWTKGYKVYKSAWSEYRKEVEKELGPEYIKCIDWFTGEIRRPTDAS